MSDFTETIRAFAGIVAHDGPGLNRVARDVIDAHGYPTSSGGAPVSGGDTSRPTETTAIGALPGRYHLDRQGVPKPPPSDYRHAQQLLDAEQAITQAIEQWCRARRNLTPTVVRHQVPAGVGNCDACNHPCNGTSDTDRLRSGLCNSCMVAWGRHRATMHDGNMPADRQTWVRARRKTHWKDDALDVIATRHLRRPKDAPERTGAIGTMAKFHEHLESA